MVILFIAQNIEITKFVFFYKNCFIFKKITAIFVIHVHKSFVCGNNKVRWSTTLMLSTLTTYEAPSIDSSMCRVIFVPYGPVKFCLDI